MDEFGAEHLALEIGKLPRLLILPTDKLFLHERADENRCERIRARIEADGVIKNPLIAAKDHGTVTHMLLDGVNRFEALRRLGCRYAPIQEVSLDDPGLRLSTWNHELEGLTSEQVIDTLSSSMRVAEVNGDFTQAGDFIPRYQKGWGCLVVLPDRRCLAVLVNGSIEQQVQAISRMVRILSPRGAMDRVSYTNIDDLVRNYPRFSALVCYKPFTKEQVFSLAVDGVLLPSGVTRFTVPKRVLTFSVPLSLLKGDRSLEEAEAELQRMIIEKIRSRTIRFYEEPTFHFDD